MINTFFLNCAFQLHFIVILHKYNLVQHSLRNPTSTSWPLQLNRFLRQLTKSHKVQHIRPKNHIFHPLELRKSGQSTSCSKRKQHAVGAIHAEIWTNVGQRLHPPPLLSHHLKFWHYWINTVSRPMFITKVLPWFRTTRPHHPTQLPEDEWDSRFSHMGYPNWGSRRCLVTLRRKKDSLKTKSIFACFMAKKWSLINVSSQVAWVITGPTAKPHALIQENKPFSTQQRCPVESIISSSQPKKMPQFLASQKKGG